MRRLGGRLMRPILSVWFGEHIWFSPIGLELESGAGTGAAGCH